MNSQFSEFKNSLIRQLKVYQISSGPQPNPRGLLVAAVLVPIAVHENEIVLIFTKRSAALERHRGQISFPGGVKETVDENLEETALRETSEEIGISRENVEILGALNSFNSSTGFFIKPFVGWIKNLNGIMPNNAEVDRILCIPFSWLMDPVNAEIREYQRDNNEIAQVWFYQPFLNETVWGITAGIIQDLLALIKK